MTEPDNNSTTKIATSYGDMNLETNERPNSDDPENAPIWLTRMLTLEGYRRLKSGNWTMSGAFLLILGLLSDTAQLATTYFDPDFASNSILSDLPVWALYCTITCLLISVIAIAIRSKFCVPCAGFIPHFVFAALVFAAIVIGQKAAFGEGTSPETGVIQYEGPEGNITQTNSLFGYFTGLNKKIDALQKDVSEIKADVGEMSVIAGRIEIKLDAQNERILKITEIALSSTEKEKTRLEEDLRQLLIEILKTDSNVDSAEILSRLPEAYKRLTELRQIRLTFEEANPEINALLKEVDLALQSGPGLSLDKAGAALKAADERYAAFLEKETKKRVEILGLRAKLAATKFDYQDAANIYRTQVTLLENIYGISSEEVANGYNALASNLDLQGNYSEAEPLYRKALEIFERELGADHPSTAPSYNNLASNLNSQGNYFEAEPLYRKALEIFERELGADHPSTATIYDNLAYNLDLQGNYSEAEPLVLKALEIRERVLGADHPSTATSYNNLASNLNSQGNYFEAEPLYRKALEIFERELGADHPSTATIYDNLAYNLDLQGNYSEAEPLVRKALEIRERVLGADHPSTATSYNTLASNLNAQGNYSEADLLVRKALEIRERVLGADHPDTVMGYHNLAFNLYSQGNYSEAELLFRKALEIFERVLGADHPKTVMSYNSLQRNLRAQGKSE